MKTEAADLKGRVGIELKGCHCFEVVVDGFVVEKKG